MKRSIAAVSLVLDVADRSRRTRYSGQRTKEEMSSASFSLASMLNRAIDVIEPVNLL
ncbi:MAG: hypothetical protein ACAF41_10920 [Leptolyngbya sp. BL-A-14]